MLLLAFSSLPLAAQEAKPPADGAPAGPQSMQQAADWLSRSFQGQATPEAAEMLIAIAKGSQLGPGEGWFHPGQTRYGWKWIAERHGENLFATIPKDKFKGPEATFAALDRTADGQLGRDDFDWSDRSPLTQQAQLFGRIFYRLNRDGDGRLTKDEWQMFFDEAVAGKEHLTIDGLRRALGSAPPPKASTVPETPLTPETLVRGLFRGEIGSMHEGPGLEQTAPDFTLKTLDGKETVRLSDRIGKQPIVLVFGNFTCGPFRNAYALVDEIAGKYKDQVTFLGVYVREAHPIDGWRMSSNDDVEIAIPQPQTFEERLGVANTCHAKLKMSIPLLVDELDDRVGHAYSGMPARLYIIDQSGKIAFKSGRGPFGFKAGELEQSLLMLLMDK
ncbi:MAG: redoxin domain-containing protein [Pirellulaceae bacterium]|nr:redoxin domain-containing protein [Pirellulaceae bacterium]